MQTNRTCNSAVGKLTLEEILVYQFRAYITPFIILFGICGNIVVLFIFSSLQKRIPCRFNLYIIGITIAHNLELIFNAFLDDFMGRGLTWLSDCTIFIKLDTQSSFACKFFTYLPEVAPMIATTVLALFSCDRVVTVYQPIKYRGDQYLYVSITGIILIYIIVCFVYFPSLIYTGLIESNDPQSLDRKTCRYLDPLNFAVQFSLYMSNIGSTIIPFAIVLVTTLLIVIKLKRLFMERTRMSGSEERGLNELRRVIGHLALTTTFFVINLPILVVVIMRQHADYNGYKELYPDYDFQIKNLSRLFSSLKSLNHALEFPTFFIFLPTFRSELRKFVKLCCSHQKQGGSRNGSHNSHNKMKSAHDNTNNHDDEINMKRKFSRCPIINQFPSANLALRLQQREQIPTEFHVPPVGSPTCEVMPLIGQTS